MVLGVSRDSVESHKKFKTKYDLPFTLLSDPGGEVCGKYDVLKEKTSFGKKKQGIVRSTFIIDEEGNIEYVKRGVKVDGHVNEVLAALR